jgi:predicted tellurium resistance membrane protein TerC
VPKGYVYFAMAFSVIVEMLNLRMRKHRRQPVELHPRYARNAEGNAQTGDSDDGDSRSR